MASKANKASNGQSKSKKDSGEPQSDGIIITKPVVSDRLRLSDQLDTYFLAGKMTCYDKTSKPYILGILFDAKNLPLDQNSNGEYQPTYHTKYAQRRLSECRKTDWSDEMADACDLSRLRLKKVESRIGFMWQQIVKNSNQFGLKIDPHNFQQLLTQKTFQGEVLAEHNKIELKRIQKRLASLSTDSSNPHVRQLIEFSDVAKMSIEGWFFQTGISLPTTDQVRIAGKTTKIAQYRALFDYYYDGPGNDPVEAERVLKDNPLWKNFSQYLHPYRRTRGIPTEELRAHPCFGWIDPKGTSKD